MDQRHIDMIRGMKYEFERADRVCRRIDMDNYADSAMEIYDICKGIQRNFLDELVRYMFEISSPYLDTISNVVDRCLELTGYAEEMSKLKDPSEDDVIEICKKMIATTESVFGELAEIKGV